MLNTPARLSLLISAVLLMLIVAGCGCPEQTSPDQATAPKGQAAFQTMDADGDGSILAAEYEAVWVARFENADADGDGKMTADEFASQMSQARTSTDLDGDGAVDRDEMLTAFVGEDSETLGEVQANDHEGIATFAAMDTNGDGKVSKMEYAAEICRWHERGDVDSDGQRTEAERTSRMVFVFDELDVNDDGVVEKEELIAGVLH